MSDWYPRYYYVMKNISTKKLYVGQRKGSIDNYLGSGSYWVNHCKKHGGYTRKNIQTLFFKLFEEEEQAQLWLNSFEEENPNYYLEENKTWANQVPETTENSPMATTNPETIEKMKQSRQTILESGLTIDQEKAIKAAETKKNTIVDGGLNVHQAAGLRSGATQKSKQWIEDSWITCEHCEKTVSPGNYKRWHGDKCKVVNPDGSHFKRNVSGSLYRVCKHCNKGPFHPANYSRWHGDNCKHKE